MAIDLINKQIYELNLKLKVSTPFLHCTIMERRGKKSKRRHILRYDRYTDGLHASEDLAASWGEVITRAMTLNDYQEDSEVEGSPKRSWMQSKRPRVE